MSSNYEKLRALLRELFQMDQADLDFGLYRIMNAKRDEIERFLEHDLLPQVKAELARHVSVDAGGKKAELDETIANAKKLGVDPDKVPRVLELRDALKQGTDLESLENEVFSHLYNFFRRYYHQGDFLSLRRYKEGVYAIPYEGEEVKLYWANHDQYYIKSSEYLRNYTFKLRDNRRVTFKVVAADADTDNNKPQNGKERRFVIVDNDPVVVEGSELSIRFRYEPDERKQADLNATGVSAVLGNAKLTDWLSALSDPRPTEKNPQRTALAKHLDDFTARYSFDYFIHKDLGGFFRRELDFFIKNEVMHLDDVEDETVAKVDWYLSKIKALRKIAHKVIAFLEQLENFQKRLWLKKKFVVASHYCVTLDSVPLDLFPAVIANTAQVEEWKRLFHIHRIEPSTVSPGYSEPLTPEFLKANSTLPVDTRFFDRAFVARLTASIENLDSSLLGVAIKADSFHGLNLVRDTYRNSVACSFIDPPYNTGSDGFPYKDNYQHSSWYAFVSTRIGLIKKLMRPTGLFTCNIDDHEMYRLGLLLNEVFGEQNRAACAPWKSEASGGKEKTGLRTGHEYLLIYHNGDASQITQAERSTGELDRTDKWGRYRKGRELRKWGGTSLRSDRPGQWFPLFTPSGEEVWPIKNDGKEGHWRWGTNNKKVKAALADPDVFHWEKCTFDPAVTWNGQTERWVPFEKIRNTKKAVGWSTWLDSHGTNADATRVLKDMFGEKPFDTPKPIQLYEWLLSLHADERGVVVDCFAGSGAVGHAVLTTNADDDTERKFLLMEMGECFDRVLLPRLKKLLYARSWKDGAPVERDGAGGIFKYMVCESYEDCLNNLRLNRSQAQNDLLSSQPELREDFTLRYMLDVEARGSASLLNIEWFRDPFAYKLNVATGTVGETREVTVDLVETFNWLLGLTVRHVDDIRGVRVVEGTTPLGERALVLWRNVSEISNSELDEWFKAQRYNTRDQEYDLIYVNGDNNLENLRRADQTWKVRMIEEDFHKLMWQCDDV
jgi:adenine-specific DNA-methyltransferase